MVEPLRPPARRAPESGSPRPLKIVGVEPVFHRDDAFLEGDPVEFHITLSRSLDALERRVIHSDFAPPASIEVKADHFRVVDLEHLNFNQVHEFLDTVNARVSQRRDEAAKTRENARARAQRLMDGFNAAR